MLFLPEDASKATPIQSLKLKPCPFCGHIGTLNAHGYLRGYGEGIDKASVRGRRVFCSNRGRRGGCGRTHAYFLASVIPRASLAASTLWRFLYLILSGFSKRAAHARSNSLGTPQRIWARCINAQSPIRFNLCSLAQPPPMLVKVPFLQVVRHLMDAFPNSLCPVSAYQSAFQISFL